MKALMALVALATLAGCTRWTSSGAEPVADNWTQWVCDTQAQVQWRFVDANRDAVDARLAGADQVYRLRAEPGGSGTLYSDGVLALHTQGDEGLVYWVATNDLIGRGCKAP